jgi:hypothetical protein
MTLSNEAYKKFMGNHQPEKSHANYRSLFHRNAEWDYQTPPTPPSGMIIYTPHDCDFPNPWETPIGAIWECHGYREGRMCYDQWIISVINGDRRWELYKRNIR